MKLCAAPLQKMAMSGEFVWEEVHQRAWKALLLLTGLEFASHVIDTCRPLFLCSDASQISVAWVLYQIVDGEIKIINLDGKILREARCFFGQGRCFFGQVSLKKILFTESKTDQFFPR